MRTTSNAGVWLARTIIGSRCEPSPAHTAHCAMPSVGSPLGTSTVTVSGSAPPPPSSVATKKAGTGAGSGASSVLARIRQAEWMCPR
jgi:hypothetical protein